RQTFVTGAWLLIAQSHLFLNPHVCRFRLRCGKTSSKGVPAIHPIVITNRYQLGRLYLYTAKLSSFGMICVSNTRICCCYVLTRCTHVVDSMIMTSLVVTTNST